MTEKRKIAIVDDDDALRDSLGVLLRFRDFDVSEFSSGTAFLAYPNKTDFACVILDIRMPEVDGLAVLEKCKSEGLHTPFIVVTAFADVSSAKTALKRGAYDYLEKPVDESDMMKVIGDALNQLDTQAALLSERKSLEERLSRLSDRETELLRFVVDGLHNREVAAALGISVRTVEVYKARMMEKMRVTRLADLIRMMTRHSDESIST